MHTAEPRARVREVIAEFTPDAGVSVYAAIRDAALDGYVSIVIDREQNTATVTWLKADD